MASIQLTLSLDWCTGCFLHRCRTLHFQLLNLMRFPSVHSSSLLRSCWWQHNPFVCQHSSQFCVIWKLGEDTLCPMESQNHGMVWFGGDLYRSSQSNLPAMGRDTSHQTRLLKAPFNLTLNTAREGAATTSRSLMSKTIRPVLTLGIHH